MKVNKHLMQYALPVQFYAVRSRRSQVSFGLVLLTTAIAKIFIQFITFWVFFLFDF